MLAQLVDAHYVTLYLQVNALIATQGTTYQAVHVYPATQQGALTVHKQMFAYPANLVTICPLQCVLFAQQLSQVAINAHHLLYAHSVKLSITSQAIAAPLAQDL